MILTAKEIEAIQKTLTAGSNLALAIEQGWVSSLKKKAKEYREQEAALIKLLFDAHKND
jgi:hypothetical protein